MGIIGYKYKGEDFTPLGMREQAIATGLLQPYSRSVGVFEALKSMGLANDFDMDEPTTYHSDDWPKAIESDEEDIPDHFIGATDERFQRHDFILKIRCSGAAFGEGDEYEYDRAQEVGRLLHHVIESVSVDGLTEGRLFDINGAACGTFAFKERED